jgi:hypothetical protein
MLVILATQEAEIRRIGVQSQPDKRFVRSYLQKNPSQKNRAGGVAQGEGPEFKPQYHKKPKPNQSKKTLSHTQALTPHNKHVLRCEHWPF